MTHSVRTHGAAPLLMLAFLAAPAMEAQNSQACRNPNGSDGCLVSGTEIDFFPARNPAVCRKVCDGDPQCRAWNLFKLQHPSPGEPFICELLSRVSQSRPNRCCMAGWREGTAPPISTPSVSTPPVSTSPVRPPTDPGRRGYTLTGNTLTYFALADASACQAACNRPDCKGWSFVYRGAYASNPDTGVCYLLSFVSAQVPERCCTSEIRVVTPSTGGSVHAPSVDPGRPSTTLRGTTLTYFASPNASSCQAACNRPDCKGWAFVYRGAFPSNPNDTLCYLMAVVTEQVAHPCCTSEVKSLASSTPAPPSSPKPLPPSRPPVPGLNLSGLWSGTERCPAGTYTHQIAIDPLVADGTFSGRMEDASPLTMRVAGDQVTISRPSWGQTWTGRLTRSAAGFNIVGNTSHGCTFSMTTGTPAGPSTPNPTPPPTPVGGGQTICNNPNGSNGCTLQGAANLDSFLSPSAAACKSTCDNMAQCAGWAWVRPNGFGNGQPAVCYRVASFAGTVASSCCVAGWKAAPKPAGGGQPTVTRPPASGGCTSNYKELLGTWQWLPTGEIRTMQGTSGYAGGPYVSSSGVSGNWRSHSAGVNFQVQPGNSFPDNSPLYTLSQPDGWTLTLKATGQVVARRICR